MSDDLNEIVTEAVEDAYPADSGTGFDANSVDLSDGDTSAQDAAATGTEAPTTEADASVQANDPSQAAADTEVDEFGKRFGLASQSITGRENRIPYSRVKKIVEKAQNDKVKELEAKFTPQLTEFQTKVQDYETRLQRVAQFEQIMENDPQTFLSMLSQVPAYKAFFDHVAQLSAGGQAPGGQPAQAGAASPEQPYLDSSTMPQPDQTLSDGSRVYSLEGLAKRDEWLAKQIEARAVKQAEAALSKRYAPIEQEWQQRERMNQIVPQIESQIAEARQWDKFNDLEPRIVEILRTDKRLSLEGAYMRAYQEEVAKERERLTTDHNKVRASVLDEIKKRPVSSSAPVNPSRPVAVPQQGPVDLDEVVRRSVLDAGLTIKD
jgi:hypothetical protein